MRNVWGKGVTLLWYLIAGALSFDPSLVHILGKKGGNFEFSDSVTVYPKRISQDGGDYPVHKHFHKRSVSEKWHETVEYSVNVNDKDIKLVLSRQDEIVAPGIVVQHFSGNHTWLEETSSQNGLSCFYEGSARGSSRSRASLSLCDGMSGMFSIDGEHFLIEPSVSILDDTSDLNNQSDQSIPHKLYYLKHSQNHLHLKSESHSSCGVDSENYKHKRRKRSADDASDNIQDLTNSDISDSYNYLHTKSTFHHRRKRSVSYKNYVEVMVAADYLMYQYHRDDLQHYILNLMAIVNSIYRNHTIQHFVHIIVVKIVIFHSEKEGPRITSNASETLKRFCKWQERNNPDESSKFHYDTAVLLTRQNICRSPEKCDTLGLAELGTMCDPERSCAIVEDNGISAAYTIAHELGHVFDLPHDDDSRCRRPIYDRDPSAQTHIMSPTIDEKTDPWSWSVCSSRMLTKFLDAGLGNCLHNKPKIKKYRKHIKRYQKRKAGSIYNVNKQCQLIYGKGFQFCPYQNSCSKLWCTEDPNRSCRTQHMPMADGTTCGQGKWCYGGQCVKNKLRRKVKGGWSKWQPYGKCSRSCGGGIKKAMRECNNPVPSEGGRYCTGKRIKYRHCNTKPCLTTGDDFRLHQCAEYNSQIRHYNIPPGSKWIPKYDGIQEKDWCKLYCKANSSASYFYMLNQKVIDGTKCRPDGDDICVNGQCRRAGCDNKLGSTMKRDRCGVCGGDNGSCRTISGSYNTVNNDYNNVTVIPAGATNIDIRQHGYRHLRDDENYLVIVNQRREYLLNGNYVISQYASKIEVEGATLHYSGSETLEERINSTGTLGEDLQIQVLSIGNLNPPNIKYSFTMSLRKEVQFGWKVTSEWTECNDICNGMRYQKVKCVRDDDQSVVSEQRCENLPKPYTEMERCNPFCVLNWKIIQEECSTNCGTGVRKQHISCTLTTRYNTTVVDMAHCHKHSRDIGPKPSDVVVCHGKCLDTHWKFSDWTECTSLCDGGAQKRSATCVDRHGNKVSELYCNRKDKVTERQCNLHPCAQWKTQDWTRCSVTCGKGSRHRKVTCTIGDREVNEAKCKKKEKPTDMIECYMGACPRWVYDNWSECSVSCGVGVAIRAVKCKASNGQVQDDFHCDATLRPYESKHCNHGECTTTTVSTTTERLPITTTPRTYTWTVGSWTQCSASCGEGIKQRYVTCMTSEGTVADNQFDCDQLTKPQETENCLHRACGYWRTGDWGKCSVSCGEGYQTRAVVCTLLDRKSADELNCDLDVKPTAERECKLAECKTGDMDIGVIITNTVVGINHWRVGPWSACSATCGTGWQRRQVLCQDENGPSDNCAESLKPESRRSCDAGRCPTWIKGEWSKCSRSCGGMGLQKRNVACQSSDGQILTETSCEIFTRPPDTGICNNGPCSKNRNWQVGPWSPCSVTCGMGASQRDVICVSELGTTRPPAECKETKPRNTKRCFLPDCPAWAHTRWSKCSTTCGDGIQRRRVVCRAKTGDILPADLCFSQKKPNGDRTCNQRPCADYLWKVSDWSNCTKDCGFGVKHREVHCVDLAGGKVNKSMCGTVKQPKNQRRCSEFPCPFEWNTGPWSECSVSCGEGSQTRRTACQAVTREGWILPGEVPYGCKASERPAQSRICNYGPCYARYRWRTAPWGECSARCGHGYERRQVQCIDAAGKQQKKRLCSKAHRPNGRQDCYNGPCYADSCLKLKQQTSIRQDGSYKLSIRGRLLEIYCRNMRHKVPQEFLTLPAGESENYSEIYPFRLKRRRTCPDNGTRPEPCTECRERSYRNAGKTGYTRIKLDIVTLQVQAQDLTYSSSSTGKHIPYGSAGDCYSAAECPQGRFNINLSGTGFAVAQNTTWQAHGQNSTRIIKRFQEGEIIQGWCGGLCGMCSPETGIQLEVLS